MAPLFGFFNSPYDWLVIALLAFLFFGNRLPTVMRSLGEGVTEFKKGMEGVDGDERSMTILFGLFNSPYDWAVIALLAYLFFFGGPPRIRRQPEFAISKGE